MLYEFKMTHRVEFSETDMAGIIHFSSFFRYMEVTEHAFFRSLGLSIAGQNSIHPVGWPRVKVSAEFRRPLQFEDEVEVHMLVKEKSSKSLTYEYRFRKINADPPIDAARGSLTVVCVSKDENGKMKATNIPEEIARLIEVAPASLFE